MKHSWQWLAGVVFLVATPALSQSATPGLTETAILSGSIQFWERSCINGEPGLPQPTSEKIAIDLQLTKPEPPYSMNTTSFRWHQDGNAFVLRFFYTVPASGKPFISGQSHLIVDELAIAECSHYGAAGQWFFPVGFCAGYVGNDRCDQHGVTFYKESE